MAEAMKKRSEIPADLCWDLSKLYPDDAACRVALDEIVEEAIQFAAQFKGKVESGDADTVVEAVKAYEKLLRTAYRAMTYASLREATDMTDNQAVRLYAESRMKMAGMFAEISFFQGELARAQNDALRGAAELAPEYAIYLGDVQKFQPHLLSPETEHVLAAFSPQLGVSYSIYETTKGTDMDFPDFEANGKSHPLSYVLYENNYCGEVDTDTRRAAFAAFSSVLRKYRNTTAAIYNNHIQQEKTEATLRGFDSVFDYLLWDQKVPREHFERHLDITMEKLGPVMRRWAKLLQKEYQLDEMRYSDLKLGLDPAYAPTVSVKESRVYIEKALEPMGKEYKEMVMRAFPDRWVDFAQNIGKSTGGFCTGHPDAQPYILLNWSGMLSEVFTLAHELGHAAQGLLCDRNNSLLEANFTRYDVEAPSTFHEMLLTRALLSYTDNDRFTRWVYAAMIENTYYHNFVTHFLEAYYQREVYRLVDQGQSLTADDFDRIFRETLEKFWGDAVVLDEGAELTWMRQPHYYMGLYSYVYSASLVISTEMYSRLRDQGEAVVADWIRYLSTGGPTPPIEHARIAGIEIEDGSALTRTIDFIESVISELEQ